MTLCSRSCTRTVKLLGGRSCQPVQRVALSRPTHKTRLVVRATLDDRDDSSEALTLSATDARELLGVPMGATFDDILRAKNRRVSNTTDDSEIKKLDAAYDTLLMESFKNRQSGKVSSSDVKYADVTRPKMPKLPQINMPGGSSSMPPVLSAPVVEVLTEPVPNALFAVTLAWSLFQGLGDYQNPIAAVPTTQLAIAFGLCLYYLRDQKRLTLQRAAVLSVGALVAGGVVGELMQAWLHVDIVPLGPLDSPEVLVSETALLALWGACALLA